MIELGELKAWLESPDADDTLVADIEKRAVAFLEQQTGRYFGEVASTTVYMSGNGTRTLWLPEDPESSPAVVVEEETSFNVWTVVADTNYVVRDYRLIHESGWTEGFENYRVTFSRGYTAGAEPETIRQAVLDLVALKYNARGNEGVRSESLGSYSYSAGDVALVPGLDETIEYCKWRTVA